MNAASTRLLCVRPAAGWELLVRPEGSPDGSLLGPPLGWLPQLQQVEESLLRARPSFAGRLAAPPGWVGGASEELAVAMADASAPAPPGFTWLAAGEIADGYRLGRYAMTGDEAGLAAAIAAVPGIAGQDGEHGEVGVVLLATLAASFAASRAALRVFTLAPGVQVIPLRTPTLPPATHTNCVLLSDARAGALVAIDPATPYPEEQQVLLGALAEAAGGRRPCRLAAVWLTHHHRDHVGAAARLAEMFGVPVCAHRETAELLRGVVKVDRLLSAGEELPIGSGPAAAVRAVHTPGHAPGHLCFLDERSGTLAAGDMVAGVGTIVIDPPEGNMQRYLESLERLADLGARRLVPAHGPATTRVREKLEGYRAHRLERERRVLAALAGDRPCTPEELVPAAYPDVAPALYPLAARSLSAHLEKLVAEGRAREAAPGRFVRTA